MDEDKNRMKCMQQQSHVFRLSIETMEPPMTDPPGVLPRADEVSAALRMLSAAQTSTLALTGCSTGWTGSHSTLCVVEPGAKCHVTRGDCRYRWQHRRGEWQGGGR